MIKNFKVNSILEQATKAQKGGGVEVELKGLTSALDGGGLSTPRPGRFTPRKESRYPLQNKW